MRVPSLIEDAENELPGTFRLLILRCRLRVGASIPLLTNVTPGTPLLARQAPYSVEQWILGSGLSLNRQRNTP